MIALALALRGPGRLRASAAAASVLDGQMKRCGPGFVFQRGVTAPFEQAFHGVRTARADCAMQGRSAIFVLGINAGAGIEEAMDGFDLPPGVPSGADYVPIRSVV